MPVGDAAGSFMGGLLQGKAAGREKKVQAEYTEAQQKYVDYQAKALKQKLDLDAKRMERANALRMSGNPDDAEMADMIEMGADPLKVKEAAQQAKFQATFMDMIRGGAGPGGAPPSPAAPVAPMPFGGGTEKFPLDPTLTAPRTSFSEEAARLLAPKPNFTFDSTGKVTVKMEPQKTRRRDTVGPDGMPTSILETEEGVGIPGGAIPVPVKLEERKKKLSDGTEVSYDVNPYTGEPAGGLAVVPKSGPTYRVSAPPAVEEFKFVDDAGVENSVIRNKQTGAYVTEPVPVAPMKGALATEGGKIEGITKGLENIKKIRSSIIKKDGSIDRGLVLKMWAPMGGIGDGRKMNSLFREALDVKIRFMTGAAISKEELPFYEQTYLPHPLDSDELIIDKLNRQEQFLQGAGATVDPAGISAGRVKKATGKPPSLKKKGDLSGMSNEELLRKLGE